MIEIGRELVCRVGGDLAKRVYQVHGVEGYLYLFVDIFSRKAVGWQVFDGESAEKAGALLEDICRRQGIRANQVTVHSDITSSPYVPEKSWSSLVAALGVLATIHEAATSKRTS